MGALILMRRAAVLSAFMMLAACSQASQPGGKAADKFAGLDGEILKWRSQILAADPLCKSQGQDQKCQSFEVACKAERNLTPQDQAKGVTAHVVAAMSWSGWDPKLKQPQSGSRAVEFTRDAAGWTRADHAPVNMESCADL